MELSKCLDSYIRFLKYEKNLTPNTIKSYQKDIGYFLDFLSERKITDSGEVCLRIFRSYFKSLENKKYSNNTAIRKHSSLKNFFRFLEENDLIMEQLTPHINTPRKHKGLYNFITINELKEVFRSIPDDVTDPLLIRNRTILEMIYSTGARVSEIEGLTVPDLDLERRELNLSGKGRKQRVAYINDYALGWLQRYLRIRENIGFTRENGYTKSKYLFLNKFGKRISSKSIRNIVKEAFARASIKKNVSVHSLRHSFATHLLNEGAGIREIQELLGHENIVTTQIYSHLNIKKLKEDYKNFHPRSG
ncbi:MAG: tyrosine-type recombinase/integrase [Actinobacteria bacterium]|nr:tyrosine-type recombinase/integrase [Actinomycetota bacterium]